MKLWRSLSAVHNMVIADQVPMNEPANLLDLDLNGSKILVSTWFDIREQRRAHLCHSHPSSGKMDIGGRIVELFYYQSISLLMSYFFHASFWTFYYNHSSLFHILTIRLVIRYRFHFILATYDAHTIQL